MSLSRIARIMGVAGVATFLVGCAQSPIPLAENFELTTQKKVRSAGHWEILSRDVVAQTSQTLERVGVAGSDFYVAEPANGSPFDRAFRDFLITDLVDGGKSVLVNRGAAVEVTYQTQVVKHRSHRPHFIPGQFTMLTAGLYALYGVSFEHTDWQLAAGLGVAALADYASSVNSGGPTHTELILTTSVSRDGRFLARKTDVYYLEDDDAFLFARAPSAKVMGVVAE